MPWYKIVGDGGPGHQTHTEQYEWSDVELKSKDDKRKFWDNYMPEYYGNTTGGLRKVDALPDKVWNKKADNYKYRLKYIREQIKILKDTPILKKVIKK